MHLRSVFIFGIVILALVAAFYANRLLQQLIKPRDSVLRLLSYLVCALACVFGFAFLLVWFVTLLFPIGKQ